jgi:hypothetical protein
VLTLASGLPHGGSAVRISENELTSSGSSAERQAILTSHHSQEADARIVIDGLLRQSGWGPADKSEDSGRMLDAFT